MAITYHTPDVDPKLLRLLEAGRSLTKRRKRQRHNRKLRLRIALLKSTRNGVYANHLSKENWQQLCYSLQGTGTSKRTWHLLRLLIDPPINGSASHRALTQTLHSFQWLFGSRHAGLENKYLHTARNVTPPSDTGHPNPDLFGDFEIYELRTSLSDCNKNSTPGPDLVTYHLLANLDDDELE